jgi:2-methylcitrate dehydratase PrpD
VNATDRILDFLTHLHVDGLPAVVVHDAKRALLDTLGCAIAGIETPLGQKLIALSRHFISVEGITVLGSNRAVMPLVAAMCNGYLANVLDADDGHRRSRLHAGGIIIPAALAAGQIYNRSGRHLLTAIIVGYELGLRAGMASTAEEAYMGSAYGATFGAAAAAGWLFGLSPRQTLDAMGIAEMHAPNCMLMGWIKSRRIPMVKEGMGWSAASGLMAAIMAVEGITGTLTIFDDRERLSRIDTLGSRFEILRRYQKPCPGCRWTHVPLQILQALIAKHRIDTGHIRRIQVRTLSKAAHLDNSTPATMEEAQYSIPFVLAAALVDGAFGPAQMAAEKLNNPAILALARRIELHAEPAFDHDYPQHIHCEVRIELPDGQVRSARNQHVHGDYQFPMTDEQLETKFRWLTSARLSSAQADDLVARIWNVDQLDDINELMTLLRAMRTPGSSDPRYRRI